MRFRFSTVRLLPSYHEARCRVSPVATVAKRDGRSTVSVRTLVSWMRYARANSASNVSSASTVKVFVPARNADILSMTASAFGSIRVGLSSALGEGAGAWNPRTTGESEASTAAASTAIADRVRVAFMGRGSLYLTE